MDPFPDSDHKLIPMLRVVLFESRQSATIHNIQPNYIIGRGIEMSKPETAPITTLITMMITAATTI